MKQTLIDLFTSKKFLAALTAVVVYVAGRFGFNVDPGTLDRIYAALLAYVGAQGLADIGKGAAEVRAAAVNPPQVATPPQPYSGAGLGAAGVLVLLLAVAGGTTACADARARATAGVGALIDCTAPELAAGVAELVPLAKQVVLAAVSGDGRHVDTAPLLAAASALKSDLGRCAVATAIAILATPAPAKPGAPAAAALVLDGGELRAAFEQLRPALGGATFRTSAGVL